MDRATREHYEQLLTLTSTPEWEYWMEELENEVYQAQADVLDVAKTWDEVCEIRGYVKHKAEVINLRDTVKRVLDLDE